MENSPFNKLSAELRNRIAEYTLQHGRNIDIWRPHQNQTKLEDFTLTSGGEMLPITQPAALAQNCKQMYRDYMPLFYSHNTFVVVCKSDHVASSIKAFLKAVGPKNASVIPGLLVDVDLGTCRHPQNISRGGHSPGIGIASLASVVVSYGWALYPDYVVVIKDCLTSLIEDLQTDAQLASMLQKCKSTHVKIRFTIGNGTETEHEIFLDCNKMKRSLMEQAKRLATKATPGFVMEDWFFLTRLALLLRGLSFRSR